MAMSTNEATRGSFPERFGEIAYIVGLLRGDFRTDGTYDTAFKDLEDAYVGVTASGDIQKENDLYQRVRPIFQRLVAAAHQAGRELKQLAQDTLVRHHNRDTGMGEAPGSGGMMLGGGGLTGTPLDGSTPAYGTVSTVSNLAVVEGANREWARQLRDPSGTAPAVTVKQCVVTATGTAGTANTGNGSLLLSVRRGDGLNNPFLPAAKGRLTCVKSGADAGGRYGHEEWLYEEAEGPDGAHPDWCEGNRGMRSPGARFTLWTADPLAFADTKDGLRGQLLYPPKIFESNAPRRWVTVAGTAGTHFLGSTTAYVSDDLATNSLRFAAGATLPHIKQRFTDESGSPAQLKGSQCYGLCVRVRAYASTVTSGVLRFKLTNSAGTSLNSDYASDGSAGTAQEYTINVASLTTTWTTYTTTFYTPDDTPEDAEFHVEVSTALVGDDVLIDGLILTELQRPYPGSWYGCVFGGSTDFVSKRRKIIPDYFDIVGTNDSGGASHPRATYQRAAAALLDIVEHDLPWPETSGTADIVDGTGIA